MIRKERNVNMLQKKIENLNFVFSVSFNYLVCAIWYWEYRGLELCFYWIMNHRIIALFYHTDRQTKYFFCCFKNIWMDPSQILNAQNRSFPSLEYVLQGSIHDDYVDLLKARLQGLCDNITGSKQYSFSFLRN